jgi:putative two-component system response regulator
MNLPLMAPLTENVADLYASTPVLIVDDEAAIRKSLRLTLSSWGCRVDEATDGNAALQILRKRSPFVVLTDLDMPTMDGFDLMTRIREEKLPVNVIVLSGMAHEQIIDEALSRGAVGYVQKPFRIPELKSQLTYALRKMKLEHERHGTKETAREFSRLFVMTSDLHHIETGSHIRRIGHFSRLMANLLDCPAAFAEELGEAAVLHDIGKLAIPDAILKKPGPLTPEEFEIMKTHPVLGGQILSGSKDPLLRMAHTVALRHHERWDGKGYPGGLKGDECPLSARIVGIVDVYDALTEKRVYKDAWPREKVLEFFREKRDNAFEGKLVDILLQNYGLFEEIRNAENVHPAA